MLECAGHSTQEGCSPQGKEDHHQEGVCLQLNTLWAGISYMVCTKDNDQSTVVYATAHDSFHS